MINEQEMDNATSGRLASLETKVDYIINLMGKSDEHKSKMETRLDILENKLNWAYGAIASITVLSGAMVMGGRSLIKEDLRTMIRNTDYNTLICREYRGNGIKYEDLPKICK